jgi:hypothetical protein
VRNLVAALSVKVSRQVERPASAEPTADDDRVWALDAFADRIWRHGTAWWTKKGEINTYIQNKAVYGVRFEKRRTRDDVNRTVDKNILHSRRDIEERSQSIKYVASYTVSSPPPLIDHA